MGRPIALLVHVPFFQVKKIMQYESQIKSKIKKNNNKTKLK